MKVERCLETLLHHFGRTHYTMVLFLCDSFEATGVLHVLVVYVRNTYRLDVPLPGQYPVGRQSLWFKVS
jgi:hypothetical protein